MDSNRTNYEHTANVYLKDSSAVFGDNVIVRSELILIPDQKLNNLPVVASHLIDSKINQNGGVRNPPVPILEAGLPRSTTSRNILLYIGVFLLITIAVGTVAAILLHDDRLGDFVTRKQWSARSPGCEVPTLKKVPTLVVIHHTVTSECTTFEKCVDLIRNMQKVHLDKNYCEVGYNFIVGGDGRVYEGRGYGKVGAHTQYFNNKTLGVAFIGDFTGVHPSDRQTQRALHFMEEAAKLGYLTADYKICGGHQLISTNSPGQKLIEELKTWTRYTDDPKKWLKPQDGLT